MASRAIRICLLCCVLSATPACKRTVYAPEVDTQDAIKNMDALLREVVTSDGYVDYDALEANRGPLDAYVAWLASDKPWEHNGINDRHHIYLNTYNILSMYLVLDRGQPRSVLDVGWLPRGGSFFWRTQFKLGRERLSLLEIQHERIRMSEMDFRSHAAMNPATRGGPPVRAELYERADGKLQKQLREQMNRWIDDEERGVRIVDGIAVFNPIFDWHRRDFEFWSAGMDLCELAAKYASPAKRKRLEEIGRKGCPHEFFDYDWALNDLDRRR